MRKTVCTLSLVALALLVLTGDLLAQRVRVGGGRFGVSVGVGGGYYYGSPYYYGRRGYYYPGWGYNYVPYYYNPPPVYYYPSPIVQVQAPAIRQANYYDPNTATITVRVPDANAQVWFDNSPTAQRGLERSFYTPNLQQAGTYVIRARWMENGQTMDQERRVFVQPGQSVMVDFHR
ncbi:MAG: TIGR03000 domain-containing protein [Planctomycetes bacterium]|nr:TIGR03000 domain-containing protein [Planctomycetota bacterium]